MTASYLSSNKVCVYLANSEKGTVKMAVHKALTNLFLHAFKENKNKSRSVKFRGRLSKSFLTEGIKSIIKLLISSLFLQT